MAKEKMYEIQLYANARWLLAKGEELPDGGLAYELIVEPDRKGLTQHWREVIEGTTFTCPQCGSHAFGSSGDVIMRGFCHGSKTVTRFTGRHQTNPVEPCAFTWPRSEDERYFTGNGHYSPAIVEARYP